MRVRREGRPTTPVERQRPPSSFLRPIRPRASCVLPRAHSIRRSPARHHKPPNRARGGCLSAPFRSPHLGIALDRCFRSSWNEWEVFRPQEQGHAWRPPHRRPWVLRRGRRIRDQRWRLKRVERCGGFWRGRELLSVLGRRVLRGRSWAQ